MQTIITDKLLHTTLQQTFHFKEFRPGQLEAILMLMNQGRLLCIQPTGHGKSLLYQLPAILLNGITLVISPLLALMRDQLMQLKTRFNIAAASINTDQSDIENHAARQAALTGNIRILFIAPEQLDHVDRFEFLLHLPINLLVVDEAHCISTWGHDFRPSYRQIITLTHALTVKNKDLKLLALTATANNQVEIDIKQQLTLDHKEVAVHRESMNRPNIRLTVLKTHGTAIKLMTLANLLTCLSGVGLIYCATRENTELVADYLKGQAVKAIAYHAGLETDLKRQIQNDFIRDKYTVIAATNALGMGIDKSNLRYIIHFDFPGSMTAYYQEVGRCGRDGLPADGILLYDSVDSKIQKYFIEAAQPYSTDFQKVLQTVQTAKASPKLSDLKLTTGLHPTRLNVVIAELVEQQFLMKSSQGGSQVYKMTAKTGVPNLSRYIQQLDIRNAELASMQYYAEQTKNCLMSILRETLGDQQTEACNQCNICAKVPFKLTDDHDLTIAVSSWLNRRTLPISLSKRIKSVKTGIAILDSKLRSPEFINFMRQRANIAQDDVSSAPVNLGLSNELLRLIQTCLKELNSQYSFGSIISIPSRTWQARIAVAQLLGDSLQIPTLPDLLYWHNPPATRQGELFNNDQRRHNVELGMQVKLIKPLPQGPILLLDDYTGSGATLNEAARALSQHPQIDNDIVPFTIAAVKWRLGKRGMV